MAKMVALFVTVTQYIGRVDRDNVAGVFFLMLNGVLCFVLGLRRQL